MIATSNGDASIAMIRRRRPPVTATAADPSTSTYSGASSGAASPGANVSISGPPT